MELVCDDPTVQEAVQALHDICEAEGAILHDALRMVVDRGHIWLESSLPRDSREVLVSLPESCLPPIEAFELDVKDDAIVIRDHHEDLPESQVRCFEAMIAIYNATGKLAAERATSPWFALAPYRDILESLVAVRVGAWRVEQTYERILEGRDATVVLESFLGSRKFNLAHRDGRGGRAVLLPFLDYANHHFAAPGFQVKRDGATGHQNVVLRNAKPIAHCDEVRVAYSILDALDTYLIYGFVDRSVEFVRSVPVSIELEGLQVNVQARVSSRKKRMPRQFADLTAIAPDVTSRTEDALTVSHILIPDRTTPYGFRRVLNMLIRTHLPNLGLERLRDMVADMEEQVLSANRSFYDNLLEKVESARSDTDGDPVLQTVIDLAHHQKACLEDYEHRLMTVTA